MSQQINRQN